MKQQVKISKVKGNPDNPRIIKNDKFKKLVKSIQEFPEMLKLRPIVVDEDMIVLGGNMRLKASKEAGLKEVWIEIAEGLTEEQKKEFIVKDNVGFGEWDWDILANEWGNVKLGEWGMDIWQPEESVSNETDYSINSLDEKLGRFLDAKIKNITIPFETEEFSLVVEKLEILLSKYKCEDYRALIYKIIENEKI
tara:strand:+ start:2930 stop:3508 length:579 start_codon:yes stop_codon:yes gene_type:complete